MHELLNAISDTLEDTILQEVFAFPYYAIIMDGSTDLSTVKQLAFSVMRREGSFQKVCVYVECTERS